MEHIKAYLPLLMTGRIIDQLVIGKEQRPIREIVDNHDGHNDTFDAATGNYSPFDSANAVYDA